MNKMLLFIGMALSSIHATEPISKSDLVDAIVEAQGLDELAETIKASSNAEAKDAAALSHNEFIKMMPDVPKDVLDQMQKASDTYLKAMDAAWEPGESLAVWKETYGEGFSEDELRQILASLKSPLAQKELSASKRAVARWRAFITDRNNAAHEEAMKQYAQTIQRIFAENPKKR